jgi:hypothetical protein
MNFNGNNQSNFVTFKDLEQNLIEQIAMSVLLPNGYSGENGGYSSSDNFSSDSDLERDEITSLMKNANLQ